MAKLDTTVGNIQRVSNMITSGDTTAVWDDNKYPSAKAIVDKINTAIPDTVEHPVGSILITSTNTNPGTDLGFSGSWILVDKAFKTSISSIGGPGNEFSTGNTGFSLSYEDAIRSDHTLMLRLGVYVSDNADKTVPQGQSALNMINLNLTRYGVYGLSYVPVNDIAFAKNDTSSAASCAVCYDLDSNGVLSLKDVLTGGSSTHTLSKNMRIHINATMQISQDAMMDSFCDKFYWKRES